jgi:hypothetical protein
MSTTKRARVDPSAVLHPRLRALAATDAALGPLAAAFGTRTPTPTAPATVEDTQLGVAVSTVPFPACVVRDVFDPAFLKRAQVRTRAHTPTHARMHALTHAVQEAFVRLPFELRSNDLYHFYQTADLAATNVRTRARAQPPLADPPPGLMLSLAQVPVLQQLRDALYSDAFVGLVSVLAGVPLDRGRLDVSGHRYPSAVG